MNPSLQRMLRTGVITREVLDALINDLEAYRAEVQRLRSREDALTQELQKERHHRRTLEQALRRYREEISTLQDALNRAQTTARPPEPEKNDPPKDREPADSLPAALQDPERSALEKQITLLLEENQELQTQIQERSAQACQQEQVRILKNLSDVYDSLVRAIELTDGPWREGLLAIEDQFIAFFKTEEVDLLGKVGETMNPWLHQAVELSDDPHFAKGQIVKVLRPGFRLPDGTVLRPAQVIVAR